MKTWIVVANRTGVKVFEYLNKNGSQVQFVTKIENPRGRLRAGDINADKPGDWKSLLGAGTQLTKLEKQQTPTERIAQEFAKKVTDFLESEQKLHKFNNLVLISDPHFLGRLRAAFSKELKRCVVKEVAKDLGTVTTQELQDRLWPQGPIAI